MATLILSSGSRINVSEDYEKVKNRICQRTGGFVELKMLVRISPADIDKADFTIKEQISISRSHIEQVF